MNDRKKNKGSCPKKPPISLKQIPPLVPSLIPCNNSTSRSNRQKPSMRFVPVYVVKRRSEDESVDKSDLNLKNRVGIKEEEEGEHGCPLSTKHIDPNSTKVPNIAQINEAQNDQEPEKDSIGLTKWRIQDEPKRLSTKSQLHEVCVAKHWKPPVYECCRDEGPCHMRLFTYKVVIEMVESSATTILECYGAPRSKKKTAAENAAEGALWYLKKLGHFPVHGRKPK